MNQSSTPTTIPESLDALIQRLSEQEERCRRERCSALVFLHADYGTATDEVLAAWRRSRGGETLIEVVCHHTPTYQPLRSLIQQWVMLLRSTGLLDTTIERLLTEVERPLGLNGWGDDGGEAVTDRGIAQVRFFETLGHLLVECSMRLPATLVLRATESADSTTAAALQYLFEYVFTDPVGHLVTPSTGVGVWHGLVVACSASRTQKSAPPFARLAGRETVTVFDMSRLERTHMHGALARPELMERLMELCDGSVTHLQQILADAPRAMERAAEADWQQLADAGQTIAALLAVHEGRSLPSGWLCSQAGGARARREMERLIELGWVVAGTDVQMQTLSMPDGRVRAFVCARLSADHRADLHARVASFLSDVQSLTGQSQEEGIALHHLRGADIAQALAASWVAVDKLQSGFAYQGAIELLEELRNHAALPEGERRVVDERLAELLSSLGQYERALTVVETLLANEDGAVRSATLQRRAVALQLSMGRYARALELIEELHDSSEIDAMWLTSQEAEARFGLGQHEPVLKLAAACSCCDDGESVESWVRLQNAAGKALLFLGRYEDADQCFERNGKAAQAAGLAQEEVRALFNQATIRLQRRDFQTAEKMLQRCISLGAELSGLVTRSFLHLNLGVVFHKTNRYDEAVSSYLRAYALFRRSGSEQQRAVTAMNLASLYETLGDRRRARELADEAIEITTRSESSYFRARALFVLGTIELSSERPDSATVAFQEARDTLAATGGGPFEHRIILGLARAAELADSRVLRDELLGQVQPDAANEEGREIVAERDLTVGTLALADGQAAAARDLLERVVSTFEALSLHERTWAARLFYGMALCGAGDLDKGTAVLRSAATLIEFLSRTVPESLREAYLSDPQRRMASDALAKAEAGIVPRLAREDRQAAEESIHSPAYAAWRARYESIVGEDERMRQIFHVVDRISESDSTVLIQGESGTGKELIAAAIHRHSPRKGAAFIKVNCAAFVETLLLSELFGHERGAFTGAVSRKKGRFELADGGTLFLDEIGDISPNTQVALLRVLQERRFERVGGSETVQVDVRLICATNRNLEEMVRSGTFRLDLYYRLKGVVIELPALRDRRADIPLLVEHFCRVHSPRPELAKSFSREAMAALVRYSWPGNIRELENLIQAIVLFVDGDIIEVSHVRQFDDFFADGEFLAQPPPFFRAWRTREVRKSERRAEVSPSPPARITLTNEVAAVPSTAPGVPESSMADDPEEWVARWALKSGIALPDLKSRIETEAIRQALTQAAGNVTRAAALLSMKRSRLSQIVNGDEMLRELKLSFGDSSD